VIVFSSMLVCNSCLKSLRELLEGHMLNNDVLSLLTNRNGDTSLLLSKWLHNSGVLCVTTYD
jgi:hypothetical protein